MLRLKDKRGTTSYTLVTVHSAACCLQSHSLVKVGLHGLEWVSPCRRLEQTFLVFNLLLSLNWRHFQKLCLILVIFKLLHLFLTFLVCQEIVSSSKTLRFHTFFYLMEPRVVLTHFGAVWHHIKCFCSPSAGCSLVQERSSALCMMVCKLKLDVVKSIGTLRQHFGFNLLLPRLLPDLLHVLV